MKKRECSLVEMIDWSRTRTVAKEYNYGTEGGVEFTDGSRIVCASEELGFHGSDVTPPDPASVVYYIVEAA